MTSEGPRDLVADLLRWEQAGAVWEVVGQTAASVTIALLRCDGGEEVERVTSGDPVVRAFVGSRSLGR